MSNINNNNNNNNNNITTTWWPAAWRWIPTSSQQLEEAERSMLSSVRAPLERIMVPTKDGQHINTIKTGSGPPLVLVHGFGAGIGFWCGNLDALSRRYTVYAMDMPGFGRSSRPNVTFKTPEQAEDFFTDSIEDWAKSVGLKNFILLGHSFGGYVSACYALKHSNRVAHLILADPWGVPALAKEQLSQNLTFRQRFILKMVSLGSPLTMLRAAGPYGPSLVARVRPDMPARFDHLHKAPEVVLNYIYHINAQSPATGEMGFQSLTQSLGWAKRPLIDRLNKLPSDIPTTFLYGEHTWMDKKAGQQLSQTMAGQTTLLEVQQSGHHLYIDNYNDFNSAVLNVSSRLSPDFILSHSSSSSSSPSHVQFPAHLNHSKPPLESGGGVTEKILTE